MADSQKRHDAIRDIGRAFGLAVNFIGAVLVLAVIGWFVDRWRGTQPTFLLVGLGLGLVIGFWQFVREAVKMSSPARRSAPAPPTSPQEPLPPPPTTSGEARRTGELDSPDAAAAPPPGGPGAGLAGDGGPRREPDERPDTEGGGEDRA